MLFGVNFAHICLTHGQNPASDTVPTCHGMRPALAALLLCLYSTAMPYPATAGLQPPRIAIIIDDMGYHYQRDLQAIRLPGAVTLSFLPHTPHTAKLARLANKRRKEILLHLPMQPIENRPVDAGGILLDMEQNEIQRTLRQGLAAVPHAVGLNNHMGSLVSQHPGHLSAIMAVLSQRNLFVVDSVTTNRSVIQEIANEHWVPNIKRDIFLDHERDSTAINRAFDRLLHMARKNGIALAIAHPYPQTLMVLKQRLKSINTHGYRLVPVSKLVNINMQRSKTWRAFLSP